MNIHKNARLTLARRIEMVRDIVDKGFTPCAAAAVHGVTDPSARKWLGRYLAEGEAGLHDRSSRPKRSPRRISPEKALAIVERFVFLPLESHDQRHQPYDGAQPTQPTIARMAVFDIGLPA